MNRILFYFFLMWGTVSLLAVGCFDSVNEITDIGDTETETETETGTGTGGLNGSTDSDSQGTDGDVACVYGGREFSAGEVFSSVEGTVCNDCLCDTNGQVACVDTECVPSERCAYNGKTWAEGDSFSAVDGCNSCQCTETGDVACTEMFCPTACEDPAEQLFEPGCGGDAHAPVIETGCYQPCDGQACQQGICQLTDINPCVCEAGMDCCNACGASQWLCLDTPEKCMNIDENFVISGGGSSHGECMGDCVFKLTTHVNDNGNCATVSLEVSEPSGTISRTNMAELTPVGTALLSGLAVELVAESLDDVYGCPDCADGGAGTIQLTRDGEAQTIIYDLTDPPDILAKADEFVMSVIIALNDCETSKYVIPSQSCTPSALE